MKSTDLPINNTPSIPMEQLILEAAERLFLDRGYAMTSTTMIAREAGCNQALVHYYYRTKENLFQTIFEEKIRLFASRFFNIDGEHASFMDKLQRSIEAHFDIVAANHNLPFLLINELTTNPARLSAIRKHLGELPLSIYRKLDDQIQEEVRRGSIRPITTFDLIITVMSLNIFFFLLQPILREMMNLSDEEYGTIIAKRRSEVANTIINSLKPLT